MAPKPRTKASMNAEAVARIMAEQNGEEQIDSIREEIAQTVPVEPAPSTAQGREVAATFDPGKVDGRTLRRTNREPFATRIKPETHEALRRIAYTRRITIAEAVEMAVAAFGRE